MTARPAAYTGLASIAGIHRRLLEMHGLDAVALGREVGIDLAAIPDPAARIDIDKLDALLVAAIPLIDDPAFGLMAARCWHPSNLGVLGHAWLSSTTLREGLRRVIRYYRIVGDRGHPELDETARAVTLRFWAKRGNPMHVAVAAAMVDIVMAITVDLCRMNAGAAFRPVAATLRRGAPASSDAYERFFGCPVTFGAKENTFTVAATDADRPLPSSNRRLAVVFDRMLEEELARLDRSDIVARCKAAVLEHLSSGELSEKQAARLLHMSARTLQRKLLAAGTTYQRLVDDTRRDLALRYVDDAGRSLTDITFSLGFSQPSAFTRAFRRWTGRSPSDFRSANGVREAVDEG